MKKLLTGSLGLFLAASLSACGTTTPENRPEEASGNQAPTAPGEATANSSEGGKSVVGGRVSLIAKANSAEYWMAVKEGAMKAGEELGVEVTFNGPDTESEGDKQLNQLESAINEKPLGIGFAPQDGAQDGAPALMDAAKEADIPVMVFDTPLASSEYPLATVASDNNGMGAQAAEKLSELVGGKGKVAVIAHGEVGTAAARRDGFKDWIAKNAPDVEIVDVQNGESDPAKSRDKAQSILQANSDLVGFFGTDDDSTTAIADEVAAKSLDVKVVGVDSSPDVMTILKEGGISGVIVQNPKGMGHQTVELLVKAARGEKPAEKNIVSESVWVTKDNMEDPKVKDVIG